MSYATRVTVVGFVLAQFVLAWLLYATQQPPPMVEAAGCRGNDTARWVLMAHMSGSGGRAHAVLSTWLRPSRDVGVLAFGPGGGTDWEKTKGAFEQALRCFPSAEIVAKFDDDSYVYTRRLIARLLRAQKDYVGYPIKREGLTYAQGGAGIILSRRAVQLLSLCTPDASVVEWEDVAVGWCMRQAGVPLTDLVGLYQGTPCEKARWNPKFQWRGEPLSSYLRPLSYHHIPPETVLRMHALRHRSQLGIAWGC